MENGNGKALAVKVEQSLTFDQMKERAGMLVKSGFLPSTINTAEKALTIMLTGQELGLGFMESLRSINVIQGKPAMAAQLLLGLCYRTKEVEQAHFEKETDHECIYVLKRKGSPPYKSSFSMEDARKMNLADKDNYKKQPKVMLGWRAISAACRKVFPDAISGIYTPEEIAEGVDLTENLSTGHVEVAEVHEKATPIAAPEPSVQGGAGLDNPLEVDRLGSYYLKPPYDKTYPDMTISEIFAQKTGSGKEKGSIFLTMVSKHSKDAEERAIVTKFLEVMAQDTTK